MDLTSVDSSVLLKSSNSFEEISSDLSDSSPKTPNSDTMSVTAFTLDHDSESDSATEAFDSAVEKLLSYEELIEKFEECNKELKTTSLKLQESEQEIEKLKSEAQKKEYDLHAKLEIAQRETETTNIALEEVKVDLGNSYFRNTVLKGEYEECKKENEELKSDLVNSYFQLMGEYEECKKENGKLKSELEAAQREIETKNIALKAMLNDFQRILNTEITKLHIDIEDRIKKETYLESLVKEREDEIEDCVAEIMKLRETYDNLWKEIDQNCDAISQIKTLLAFSETQTEDFLRATVKEWEKQVELHVEELKKQVELQRNSEDTVEELRDRIEELEEQAEMQRKAISKVEKEKNQVIRGLYLCLDHYNVGHKQIMEFFS